jgi:hypothetical protein
MAMSAALVVSGDRMKQPLIQELSCGKDDLLVFIDDTGHESFAGDHEYYGLGGCLVLGGAHYSWLKAQWRDVRRRINGSPDAPLHASTMERNTRNFSILSKFFLDRSFARVAVTSIRTTTLPSDMPPTMPVTGVLNENISAVASLLPCTAVIIVVESSQRADPILRQCFGALEPDGAELTPPFKHWLMPKSVAEPGLEIADFVISAAKSQTQRYIQGRDGLALDFDDVFCRLPPQVPQFCQFSLITGVYRETGRVGVQGFRLVGNTLSSIS